MRILPLDDAKRGMAMLAAAGMRKMNISGGEPFLQARFIGEIFKYCKEELGLESCSVVNNGSKVTEKWLDTYGKYLDFMAISIDSFDPDTNIRLGRSDKGSTDHIRKVFEVAEWCVFNLTSSGGPALKLDSLLLQVPEKRDHGEAEFCDHKVRRLSQSPYLIVIVCFPGTTGRKT